MNDYELEKLNDQFDDELSDLVKKYNKLPIYMIVSSLMRELKFGSCFDHECYYYMLGELNDMLNTDLEIMFEDIKKCKKIER